MRSQQIHRAQPLVLFLSMTLIWGFTWPLYVVGLRSFTPFMLASVRNLIAVLVLLPLTRWQRVKIPREPRTLLFLSMLGLFWIIIPYALVFWGIQFTTSGVAAVLNGTNPFFIALFAWVFFRTEQATLGKALALFVGFLGVTMIFSDQLASKGRYSTTLGDGAMVLSAASVGLAQVLAKRFGARINSLVLVAAMDLVGGIALLGLSFLFDPRPQIAVSLEAFAVALYLGVLASAFGFVAYTWLLKRIDAVRLSMVAFLVPVISLFVGAIWLKERVTPSDICGSALVLLGLAFMNFTTAGESRLKRFVSVWVKHE